MVTGTLKEKTHRILKFEILYGKFYETQQTCTAHDTNIVTQAIRREISRNVIKFASIFSRKGNFIILLCFGLRPYPISLYILHV